MTTPGDIAQLVAALERPLLLATDVDGTIAPIVEHPSDARIHTDALVAIAAIAGLDDVHVALATGRDLESLRHMESLPDIWRVVEHGGLVVPPNDKAVRAPLSDERAKALEAMRAWVSHLGVPLVHASHAVIETKPRGVALHTRKLAIADPDAAGELLDRFETKAAELGLRVRRGRHVREAEIVPQDKSRGLESIQERVRARSLVYIGDDLTDFAAIELAHARGAGVFVRSDEQTDAPEHVTAIWNGVDDVVAFLQALAAVLQ